MLPDLCLGIDRLFAQADIQGMDLFEHCLILGKSGTGKSTLLLNWWRTLCYFPIAKIMIEPSGFLTRDAYSVAKGKAIYCSQEHPTGLNPMRQNLHPNTISNTVAEAMNQVIELQTDGSTTSFTAPMRVMLDKGVKTSLSKGRKSLLSVRDEIAAMQGNALTRDGILSRMNFLLADERFNKILCSDDTLDIEALTANARTFILDCSGMTHDQMIFAGNVLSQSVTNYLRYCKPETYKPLAMFIDEAHNFTSVNWLTLIKEGRKYKLAAILASQDLAFFPEKMKTVLLNLGSTVTFRLGHQDAHRIAMEMLIPFQEIQTLPKFDAVYSTPSARGRVTTEPTIYFRTIPIIGQQQNPVTATSIGSPAETGHPPEAANTIMFPVATNVATSTHHADLGALHADLGALHDDAGALHDDAGALHGDAGALHGDVSALHEDYGAQHDAAGVAIAAEACTLNTYQHQSMPTTDYWFPLEPYQPHETMNSEAVSADAHRAKTPPSRTVDG